MDNLFWIAFSFAAISTCAAIWFLVLWMQTRTKLAIAISKLAEQRSREELIDELKDHTVHAAKSAALEAGQQLSNKLLDDHKRENEAARELHGKATKQITETLMQQAQAMSDKLAHLHENHGKQSSALDKVMKALTNPTGAGKIAEIGLENLLKSFGLEAGRDFDTQFSMTTGSGRLRPDALVYLPQNRAMVIDCKSSSFLLDDTADAQLKTTMNKHLNDLATKDYRSAVIAEFKKSKNAEPIDVWSVLYVPTESLAERIKQVDSEFIHNLMKHDIILASPATLHGLLSLARVQIENEKQVANSEKIVEAAGNLLDGIITAFGHVEKLAASIKSSVTHFNAFAGSANTSILGRASKFASLGVSPSRGKTLPTALPRYDVISRDASDSAEIVELSVKERV
jgi:DNA recombination protein RmuC